MTLVVVGSNPTIHPLDNINYYSSLKDINFKKVNYIFEYNERLETIFSYKKFYSIYIKILYYYFYLNKIILPNDELLKNDYYIILNKKKNHYYINIIKNNFLISSMSVGTMLAYFRFKKKCLRRSKKGFFIFLNTFKQFFKQNSYENINILVNFIDQNFVIFKKNFFKNLKLTNLFFFSFNKPFHNIKYKKYKNIKRRLKKKFLKKYVI